MTEAGPENKTIFVVPEYAKNSNIGEERRKAIVMALGFSDGDGRKEWAFKKLCEYAVGKKNAKIAYADFVGWLINNSDLIKGENNIRQALSKTLEGLESSHYCVVSKDHTGEIISVVLMNPVGKMCGEFLENFYAKNKNYDYRQSYFLHSMSFINVATLASQLALDKKDVSKVISSVSLNVALKKSLKEISATELAQIDINIPGLASNLQLIMSSADDFKLFLKETVFAFLAKTLEFSVPLRQRIASKINIEPEQLKIEQGNVSSWIDAYIDSIKEVENTGENFFEKHFFKEAARKEMKGKVEGFYLKVLAIAKAIDVFGQNEAKDKQDEEQIKANIAFLVKKSCMEIHKSGFRGFFDIKIFDDMVFSGKNLNSFYSKDELLQKLQTDDASFVYFSGISKFTYKNLFISGLYSEITEARETMRNFLKGIVRSDSKTLKVKTLREVAKKRVSSQMAYILYFMKNYIVKNEKALAKQLFLSEDELVKLEVVDVDWGNDKIEEQVGAFKYTLFQEGDVQKPIENSEIIISDIELKKLLSESEGVLGSGGSSDSGDKIGILGILFFPITIFFRLFGGGGSKKKEKESLSKRKPSASQTKTSAKSGLSPTEIRAKFPSAPEKKEDLVKKMMDLERQWNSILVDPRKIFRDWDQLNAVEKKAKQPAIDKEEASLREAEREKLISIIRKYRSKVNLKEFDEPVLKDLCGKIANEISTRTNKKALQEYIFLYILNDII